VSRQAVRLGFLPHLAIHHTSNDDPGQVYVPVINALLFVAVLAVTIGFGSSTRLATAYGVAVTGTLLITTSLLVVVARVAWSWRTWRLIIMATAFGAIELAFFTANLSKILKGGWLPLIVALAVFTVMSTWQRGRELVSASRLEEEGTLTDFVAGLDLKTMTRVPGLAVYPHSGDDTTPIALRVNVERNHALHEQVVIIIARTRDVPHVPIDERLDVDHLGRKSDGIVTIDASFGFQDRPDIPTALEQAASEELEGDLEIDDALYFLSGVTLERSAGPGMARWRKMLFIALTRRTPSQADYLCLPDDRTTNIGTRIAI
jgi:KUP system potassium uptake protein